LEATLAALLRLLLDPDAKATVEGGLAGGPRQGYAFNFHGIDRCCLGPPQQAITDLVVKIPKATRLGPFLVPIEMDWSLMWD